MKKMQWLLAAALPLALLFSCQKEVTNTSESSSLRNPTVRANAQPVISFSTSTPVVGVPFNIYGEYGTCGNGQLQQEVPAGSGTWVQVVGNTSATAANPDITASFTATAVGTYNFRLNTSGGQNCTLYTGPSSTFSIEVTDPCKDELSSNFVCGAGTVTFTFTATEAGPIVIQGGLSAGAVITSATSNVLELNPDHPSAGGPSSVTRWQGTVEACTNVTVTINYTGGSGIGAWSAKRGELVLGSTAAVSCP